MSKELSADPKKNRNWREVYQQRVEALESRVRGWEELYSRSELSGVEEKVLLLRKEALVLGKMITKYHNYVADDTIKWRKRNGFMAGKSVFLDDDAIFWIFKSPGETMAFGGARYPNYISKDRQNKVVRTTEDRLHNISYSRGFLEVYSLAEIMMPEYIMPFAVAQKLKYPDQFFVATRFVDDAQPLREETLRSNADIVDRFKSVRLIGSIIGFDDMIYPNILVDQRQKLVAIDGINPISDNNKRRNFLV